MALPDLTLATINDVGELVGARAGTVTDTRDVEDGGIALSDPSEGHLYQTWITRVSDDQTDILLSAQNFPEQSIYTGSQITEVSLTFDQNMRQTFAFVDEGLAKLYWYDSDLGDFTVTTISNAASPRVILDDKRVWQMQTNDILLAYISNQRIKFRQQRDRFLVEYDVGGFPEGYDRINKLAFGSNYRLHIVLVKEPEVDPPPDCEPICPDPVAPQEPTGDCRPIC